MGEVVNTKFEFVIKKHQLENLLAKYLSDPTNYDWNGNLRELKLELQLLKTIAAGVNGLTLPNLNPGEKDLFVEALELINGSLIDLTKKNQENFARYIWARTLYEELVKIDGNILQYLFSIQPDESDG